MDQSMDHPRRTALVRLSRFTIIALQPLRNFRICALISGLVPSVSEASFRRDQKDPQKRHPPFLLGLIGDEAAPGETIEIIIKGRHLAEVHTVEFDSPLITSRIVVTRDTAVTVELNISPEIQTGPVHFFVCTPFGRVDSRASGIELMLHDKIGYKLAQSDFRTPGRPRDDRSGERLEQNVHYVRPQKGIGGDLL